METDLADEQRVHDAVVDAVLSHRLPPGTRLIETPMAEAFGVNRTLLRRVFVRLASEKVIELQHNRGASVAQPSRTEMREVFDVRRLIEGGIVRRLCGCARPADLTGLRKLVERERQAYEGGDLPSWHRLSGEFHLAAARAVGNSELASILQQLVARTTLMKALYQSPSADAGLCSFDEHAAILDAMAGGDADRAGALMDAHLQDAEMKLRRDAPAEAPIDFGALFGGKR